MWIFLGCSSEAPHPSHDIATLKARHDKVHSYREMSMSCYKRVSRVFDIILKTVGCIIRDIIVPKTKAYQRKLQL
jgi:hypothetical protein